MALLLPVLVGCRLDVVADVVVDADGTGSVAVVIVLDDALLDELDALGVDPTAELVAAAEETPGWSLSTTTTEELAIELVLERRVDEPQGFGAALAELSAGLTDEDPALLIDLDVEVDADGATRVVGTGGLRPPATAGAILDGEPIGPSGDELAGMVAGAVAPALRVTLPAVPSEHDADERTGRQVRWELPVGDERSFTAVAEAPPWWFTFRWWLAGALAALVVLVALVAVVVRRRRNPRRRRRERWAGAR